MNCNFAETNEYQRHTFLQTPAKIGTHTVLHKLIRYILLCNICEWRLFGWSWAKCVPVRVRWCSQLGEQITQCLVNSLLKVFYLSSIVKSTVLLIWSPFSIISPRVLTVIHESLSTSLWCSPSSSSLCRADLPSFPHTPSYPILAHFICFFTIFPFLIWYSKTQGSASFSRDFIGCQLTGLLVYRYCQMCTLCVQL